MPLLQQPSLLLLTGLVRVQSANWFVIVVCLSSVGFAVAKELNRCLCYWNEEWKWVIYREGEAGRAGAKQVPAGAGFPWNRVLLLVYAAPLAIVSSCLFAPDGGSFVPCSQIMRGELR
jgi:hypothetical protein